MSGTGAPPCDPRKQYLRSAMQTASSFRPRRRMPWPPGTSTRAIDFTNFGAKQETEKKRLYSLDPTAFFHAPPLHAFASRCSPPASPGDHKISLRLLRIHSNLRVGCSPQIARCCPDTERVVFRRKYNSRRQHPTLPDPAAFLHAILGRPNRPVIASGQTAIPR